MTRKKHIPQRTCVVCRKIRPKREMLRVVKTSAQTLIVDQTGKAAGRGAYVCADTACWQGNKFSKDTLGRALKMTISDEEWTLLHNVLASLP